MIDNDYKQKTKIILDFIVARNCSPETRRCYNSCYNELGDYLSSRQVKYSADAANKWIQNSCGSLGRTAHELYAAALRKLEDLYSTGKIKQSHYTALTRKHFLSEKNRGFLADYIQDLASSGRALETISNHQIFAARLFLLQQQNGCPCFLDSSYNDLLWLCGQFNDKTYYTRTNFHTVLNSLLESAYSKGWVPFGYTLFVKGMAMRKGCYWNNVSPDQISDLKARQADRRDLLSLSEYYALGADLLEEHRSSGYSANRVRTISRFIDLFYLFMDMNSLLYEPKVVETWLPSIKPAVSYPEFVGCRRFFILIEQQYRNIPHDLSRYFFFRETLIERLPQWARPAVDEFIDQKQAEGWKRSPSHITLTPKALSLWLRTFWTIWADKLLSMSQLKFTTLPL